LFYLAPGCGYLLGTFVGGRYADFVVRKHMKRRGERIPEDRLKSALPFMAFISACVLVYGWALEKDVGGIPLVVIVLFLQGFAQLFCFPSLNTYCLDVMPGRSGEVIAGNYVIRYLFACASTAAVLPAVDAIGIGWFSTISVVIMLLGTLSTLATVVWGKKWRENVDARNKARRLRERQEESRASQDDVVATGVPAGNTPAEHVTTPETKPKVEV
jgi:MFS family permease